MLCDPVVEAVDERKSLDINVGHGGNSYDVVTGDQVAAWRGGLPDAYLNRLVTVQYREPTALPPTTVTVRSRWICTVQYNTY